ncbi:hypothetical protein MWU61_18510 [Loktanella sp. F6476L]|uniref:hypothetical protein n=1 Tax=Loktanella sp. F6476L TaxID=2926405 RepID=UPI001FF28814|nr:hypothetical protein [Loktanella sp. F6476L]MCK0122551.1 hypothetical protein [Loktanella sp. F6476L]
MLQDLWLNDIDGFERYPATQVAGRPSIRNQKIWAAFVNQTQDTNACHVALATR